jgi:transcription elongation factor Elf1
MPDNAPCPRCQSPRLSVVYYDADGRPLGGHVQCSECGSRHSAKLVPLAKQRGLLERKAS